jgi:hypothetical protein
MSITVGTDTYISLADAETYVTGQYIPTDAKHVAWAALTDANKEILLKRATKVIDRQPLTGIKAVDSQTLEFPRAIMTDYNRRDLPITHTYFSSDWYLQTETPQVVKDAQVEIALQYAEGVPKRLELQQQGVKSFGLGKLSESYGSGSSQRIVSVEAKELLRPFLAGSVAIK